MIIRQKKRIVLFSQIVKEAKNVRNQKIGPVVEISFFRVRRWTFSLKSREIRPSEFVGTRRKVALRGESNVWAPVLRSFDKLHEVGVLSYLF